MASEGHSSISFSIITPVLNAAGTIERTLESISAQKVACEHIVLDAGSTDGTLDILQAAADRIAYLRSAPDNGIAAAFNEGIEVATGDYLLFLNADDYLLDGALELVSEKITRASVLPDVVFGDVMILDEDGTFFAERASLEPMADYMSLYHPSMYFRRTLFDELGQYDPHYDVAMDSEFVHRALAAGCEFLRVDAQLAVMARGGLSDTLHWRSLVQFRRSLLQHKRSGWLRSGYYLLRQYLVHRAVQVPMVKRWRLARR